MLQSLYLNIWRDLLQWPVTVPLSLELTVDCLPRYLYMTEKAETLERPDYTF